MKKVFEAIIILLIVSSCETDFNIEASEKEIPVVYGVLNVSEPKQYIRVQRAFLSKGGNVADLSKDPDILYYSEGRAILTVTGTGRTILGKRINTEDIGIKRDSGFFAESPNILYEFETKEWLSKLGISSLEDLEKIDRPYYYEIRLSNKCNLMCRSCKPEHSHLIDKEYKKFKIVIGWLSKVCLFFLFFTNLQKKYILIKG